MMCAEMCLFPECGNHRIARQPELAQLRPVMQVNAGRRVHELEHHAARQRFAPKKLVVPAERGTQGVRILFRVTRRVRPKIEGDVNLTACPCRDVNLNYCPCRIQPSKTSLPQWRHQKSHVELQLSQCAWVACSF